MIRQRRRPAAGFTLIEIMTTAAILGVLASLAVPSLTRLSLRAKTAERVSVMSSIATATRAVIQLGDPPGVPGGILVGNWNPPLPATTNRRPFDTTQAGWNQLHMVIEGATYYAYTFVAVDGGRGGTTTLDIRATGDLDGDGIPSTKWMHYQAAGYQFQLTIEDPLPGQEDTVF